MPRFQDATGYFLELRNEVNESWYSALCDMALNASGQAPNSAQLTDLWDYLHRLRDYSPAAAVVPPVLASAGVIPSPPAFLEELSDFSGFKKLSPGLHVQLGKQVSLIFGKNGSGKSSVCQVLKVLANPETPTDPLHNVHTNPPAQPSFAYRFSGASSASTWTKTNGFGTQSQSIKYFDSTVAIRHATSNIRPEIAVEISVFRLEVFEYARSLLRAFQTYASHRVNTEREPLQARINELKTKLRQSVNVDVDPFFGWSPTNSTPMAKWLSNLPIFDSVMEEKLAQMTISLDQHLAASSEEGMQALRAQLTLMSQMGKKLSELRLYCMSSPLNSLQAVEEQLSQKQAAAHELSTGVFLTGINPTDHQALIASAATLTNFADAVADNTECPLCHQTLNNQAEVLFRAYHTHLTSTLQAEIASLIETLSAGNKNLERIRAFDLGDFTACQSILPGGFLDSLVKLIETVRGSVPLEGEVLASGDATMFSKSDQLTQYLEAIGIATLSITEAIKKGTENKAELDAAIKQLQEQIGGHRANQTVCANRQEMLALCQEAQTFTPLANKVSMLDFANLLRKMTIKGKEAHSELVLGTFQQQLNQEYLALCGMTLSDMGVRLASRGDDQDVIVTSHVGTDPLHRVLSEGEQKVHALAVFMCEAVASPHQILVFDDPVTSFDYNYISNFCERLRDLIRHQPQTQIIILTHNWDFFVNLQTIINRSSGLNTRLSVQVLEDCATVSEYSEKWEELCQQIESTVQASHEPSADEKEKVSGLMRRLIERLTNRYVFNEQRHQYKMKALNVSVFTEFTKIVPLLPDEAIELRDLYSNLSPLEHDDVRNYYMTKTKQQFNCWYNNIIAIKDAIESRKL